MNDFFEEYGLLVISMVGGSCGIGLLFRFILNQNSPISELLKMIIRGLM